MKKVKKGKCWWLIPVVEMKKYSESERVDRVQEAKEEGAIREEVSMGEREVWKIDVRQDRKDDCEGYQVTIRN